MSDGWIIDNGVSLIKTLILLAATASLAFIGYRVLVSRVDKTTAPTPTTFSPGIYYRLANPKNPSAQLAQLEPPASFEITMTPVDFDINDEIMVFAEDNVIRRVRPNGQAVTTRVQGLYQIARPSLSPDGQRVAAQAAERPNSTNPTDLGIYVIELASGSYQRISPAVLGLPAESPSWFHRSNKIAYSTFSATLGVDIHIYDVDQSREVLTIPKAGWLHLAISDDDQRLLVPITMQVYDLTSGQLLFDLKERLLAQLRAVGLERDTQHTGDFNNFPLDGDFSPDGTQIVFDGAVTKGGKAGMMIGVINTDGTDFKVIQDFIEINPEFANNNNYSQINPVWR